MQLLNTDSIFLSNDTPLEKLPYKLAGADSLHPALVLQQQHINIASAGVSVVKNENKPDFSGRFFSQRLYGLSDPFSGFSVAAAIPIFGSGAYKNKVRAAQAEMQVQQKQFDLEKQLFNTQQIQAQKAVERNMSLLAFYEQSGLAQAKTIIQAATLAYRSGEIGFAELSQFITQAIDIQRNYLDNLNAYNQAVIEYNYFINQ
jgi:cobalt-zinc-cadmium resistance protein CzcA